MCWVRQFSLGAETDWSGMLGGMATQVAEGGPSCSGFDGSFSFFLMGLALVTWSTVI